MTWSTADGQCFFSLSLLLLFSLVAAAQVPPSAPVSGIVRSYSGQFVVQALPVSAAQGRAVANLHTNRDFAELDAALLPVSCERIKQILWSELGIGDTWVGRIFITVYPAQSAEDPITLNAERFRDGWQYRLALPHLVPRAVYVRAIVEALLLEFANREARDHTAEIPPWLSEGLAQQLLLFRGLEIILAPPRADRAGLNLARTIVDGRKENPLAQAHQTLSAAPPLTFQQLSWPGPEQFSGEAGALYRSSAQLFVTQLLHLPNGPLCLRAMLKELPRHYNWQFAFLDAFHAQFPRPVEVEKWWTLQVLHFTGRDLAQTWPPEESWQKLDQLVRSPVQVRVGTNEMPLVADVRLQTMIRQWDGPRQTQALQAKLQELQQLRLRLARDIIPLADAYQQALQAYLRDREHTGSIVPFRKKAAQRHLIEDTVRRLDLLDAQMLDSKPPPSEPTPVQTAARPLSAK